MRERKPERSASDSGSLGERPDRMIIEDHCSLEAATKDRSTGRTAGGIGRLIQFTFQKREKDGARIS